MKAMVITAVAVCGIGGLSLLGQTRVDLEHHGQKPLFGGFAETQPMQIGSALPSNCSLGDFFFLSSATPGSNVYACTAANTWSLEAGGSGGGGSLSVKNSGTLVGSSPVLDFFAGFGLLEVLSDAGSEITVQPSIDATVVETHVDLQSGATLRCASSGTTGTQYNCSMSPTLTAYTAGMVLNWTPDVSSPGSAITLNVDTLGAVPVTLADGTGVPAAGDLAAGEMYSIWFDGSVFRAGNLLPLRLSMGPASAQPACSAAQRGRFWQIPAASGVKDNVSVCAKDASDVYAWRELY